VKRKERSFHIKRSIIKKSRRKNKERENKKRRKKMEDVIKTLKVRIKNEVLTTKKKERLRKITGIDTRIIN